MDIYSQHVLRCQRLDSVNICLSRTDTHIPLLFVPTLLIWALEKNTKMGLALEQHRLSIRRPRQRLGYKTDCSVQINHIARKTQKKLRYATWDFYNTQKGKIRMTASCSEHTFRTLRNQSMHSTGRDGNYPHALGRPEIRLQYAVSNCEFWVRYRTVMRIYSFL